MAEDMRNPVQEADAVAASIHQPRTPHGVPATYHRPGAPMAIGGGFGAGAVATSTPAGGGFDVMGLLKALRRRWFRALVVGVVLGGVVGGIAWNVVPAAKYTASAVLQVRQHRPTIVFTTRELEPEFRVFQRTQIAYLKSPKVLAGAVRDTKVAQLPTIRDLVDSNEQAEWLKKELQVSFSDNSEILEVSLSGDRPSDLQMLVDAVVESYIRNVVDLERQSRLERLDKLRKLWEKYTSELKTKQTALKALSADAGGADRDTLTVIHMTTLDNIADARRRVNGYKEEIRKLTLALQMADAIKPQTGGAKKDEAKQEAEDAPVRVSEALVEQELEASPLIVDLHRKEAQLDASIHRYKSTVRGGSDPVVFAQKKDLAKVRAQLKAETERLRPIIEERLAQRMGGVGVGAGGNFADGGAATIAQAKINLKLMQEYLLEADKELLQLQADAKKQNMNAIDVTEEQESIRLALDTARKVGTEVESLEVELMAPDRVTVISKADLPRKKDEMKRLRLIGSAVGGSFVMALLAVGFMEFRARRIGSVEEVVSNVGMNIVGSLPAMPDRPKRRLGGPNSLTVEERWQRLLVESVDAMRTMLLHASRVESLKVVMITSAGQGEGKTSLAGHLATSLARAGRRTLLVDCDLRRPTVHRLFDEPIDPGLSELLRGEISAVEAIRQGPTSELSVVTAGRSDEVAMQVLGQDRVREIFDEWRAGYEFIIVDTPPVLPVADALFLSQHVDGVLFAILRDVSRVPQVQAAYERLTRLGARMLGAVVNGAQADPYQFANGYYNGEDSAE